MALHEGGGGLECHIPILKNDVFENHLESFLTVRTYFALSLGFILCIYSRILVKMLIRAPSQRYVYEDNLW